MLITVVKPHSQPCVGARTNPGVTPEGSGGARGLRAIHADRSPPLQEKPPADTVHSSNAVIHVIIVITGDAKFYQFIKKKAVCSW